MNKQELIDKLNKQLTTPSEGTDFDYGHDYGIRFGTIRNNTALKPIFFSI